MNSGFLLADSVQLLAILAVEVALICVAVAVLARRAPSGSWRRVFWQAGLVAVLGLTAGELSGLGRTAAGWTTAHLGRQRDPRAATELAQPPVRELKPEFRSQVEARVASQRSGAVPLPVSTPGAGGDHAERIAEARVPVTPSVVTPVAASTGAPAAQQGAAASADSPTSSALGWLWFSWAGVTLLLGGRVTLGRCLLFLMRFRRRRVTDAALLARVRGLEQRLGLGRRVRLVESGRLRSPIAFGVIRPTIGLPLDFAGRFTPERQEAMLAHELAHLAAHDPAWSLVADLCLALLWWHPAVWWARREFRLASELAADEASLVLPDGPAVLAECLLEMGTRLAGHRELGQLRISGFRSHLGRRVQRLVHLEARAWSPPPRLRSALMLFLTPLWLAALVVVCTAWAVPRAQTKGNAMQSMQLSLKRSLATLAVLASVNAPGPAAAATDPGAPAAQPNPAANTAPAAGVAANTFKPRSDDPNAAFRRRYGLGGGPADALPVTAISPKRQKIETKLDEIILPEIQFDGLPLSEVIKALSDSAARLDHEKKGINFLINNNNPPVPPGMSIDPATGLPTATPAESIDVASVTVKFSLPLRNVSLKDTLEAVMKVADRPIEYSVEDFGVVVSLKAEAAPGKPFGAAPTPAQADEVVAATFKVDTNTFLAGLQNAFGIKVSRADPADGKDHAREIQSALKALLTQLGVGGGDAKTIFYNDLTGMIMVRVRVAEQGVVQAAIETLGGTPAGSYPTVYGENVRGSVGMGGGGTFGFGGNARR